MVCHSQKHLIIILHPSSLSHNNHLNLRVESFEFTSRKSDGECCQSHFNSSFVKYAKAKKYSSSLLLFFLDENSCQSSPCSSNAVCANTGSSFTCTCNSGFTGTGILCSGNFLLSHFRVLTAHEICER